jgi:pyruvate formate lyase activating enzyme
MEAYLYDKLEKQRTRCRICHHFCVLDPGQRGICGVRENRDGRLLALTYDKIIAHSVDPIEKKPIFHLKPGSLSYSIATMGCNFQCRFCQNADIAQVSGGKENLITGRNIPPADIVTQALAAGCDSISYTYTEPSVFFELAFDTARLAKDKGLLNVFVTNGYMSPDLVTRLVPYLDAANVDLKAFCDEFYRTYCNARLGPVKQTLKRLKRAGILVEVTTLLIPGLNDDPEELSAMARFIAQELGCDTPWHLSRFHPTYRMTDRGPTPVSTVVTACDIGKKAGLHYVYSGNVPGSSLENTRCHRCDALVVERTGYRIVNHMKQSGVCPACDTPVAGIY